MQEKTDISPGIDTLEALLGWALVAAVALNFANVVGRYGFGYTLLGADEAQVYVLAFVAFVGAGAVSARGLHLRMDVLAQMLPKRLRACLQLAELLLTTALAVLVLVSSVRYVSQMFRLNALSENLHLPMWIPHSSVTLGFAIVLGVALVQLARLASGRAAA